MFKKGSLLFGISFIMLSIAMGSYWMVSFRSQTDSPFFNPVVSTEGKITSSGNRKQLFSYQKGQYHQARFDSTSSYFEKTDGVWHEHLGPIDAAVQTKLYPASPEKKERQQVYNLATKNGVYNYSTHTLTTPDAHFTMLFAQTHNLDNSSVDASPFLQGVASQTQFSIQPDLKLTSSRLKMVFDKPESSNHE